MEIRQQIQAIATLHGSAFVALPVTRDTREALLGLAGLCGVNDDVRRLVDDKDLVALYSVTRKRTEAGREIGAKLNRKYGSNGPSAAPAYVPPPAPPASAPEPRSFPAPAPVPSGDYVTPAQLDRVQAALMRTIADTLGASGTALQAARAEIMDGLRAELMAGVSDMVADALKAQTPISLVVTMPNAPAPVALGTVHYRLPKIIQKLAAGLNVYLHGPAGSGKTTAAKQVADALGVAFYAMGKVESEYLLLGFRDGRGEVVRTPFREAYENGGAFLLDEMDASADGAVTALNMALANGVCAFPDGLVKRHPQFYCIGAGNTALRGASRQYVSRNQMDGASINRFYFIEFGYDEKMELALATNKDWARHVQAIRHYVADRGLDLLVTPRATFDGAIALATGDDWAEAEEGCIFKGLDADTVEQIRRACPAPASAANPFISGVAA